MILGLWLVWWLIIRGRTIPDFSHFLKSTSLAAVEVLEMKSKAIKSPGPRTPCCLMSEVHRSVRTQVLGIPSFSDSVLHLECCRLYLQEKPKEKWTLNIPVSPLICSVSSSSRELRRQQTHFSAIFNIDTVNTGGPFIAKDQASVTNVLLLLQRKGVTILSVKVKLVHEFLCYLTDFSVVQLKTWKWIKSNIFGT